jgi:dihydroflavonol-4-reductase
MRVLVTGGTGFVGCHTVAALLGHGHHVRLLVRDARRIAPALGPLGIATVDAVVGDVTDPATVERAMRGCQAVVHAAAVYALDPRRAAVMAHTNPPAPTSSWGPPTIRGWTRSSTCPASGCSGRPPRPG